MRPEQLLDEVRDRASFITFVEALIKDWDEAGRLEKENPKYWRYGAPNGWQNGSIGGYLDAALACMQDNPSASALTQEPSWRALAEFLYAGKIYE